MAGDGDFIRTVNTVRPMSMAVDVSNAHVPGFSQSISGACGALRGEITLAA